MKRGTRYTMDIDGAISILRNACYATTDILKSCMLLALERLDPSESAHLILQHGKESTLRELKRGLRPFNLNTSTWNSTEPKDQH